MAVELLLKLPFFRSVFYKILYDLVTVFNSALESLVNDAATSLGGVVVPHSLGWQMLQSSGKMLGFAQTVQTAYTKKKVGEFYNKVKLNCLWISATL